MVKVEELHDGTDDGFITEDSSSDPSDAGLPTDPRDDDDDGASDLDPDSDIDDELALTPWDPSSETLFDRLYALRDIVPPSTRRSIALKYAALDRAVRATGGWMGGAAWVVTTSLLLVGLPMALSIEGETMLVAQEKEFERQQHGQQSLVGGMPGQPAIGGQPQQAGTGPTSVTPPGF